MEGVQHKQQRGGSNEERAPRSEERRRTGEDMTNKRKESRTEMEAIAKASKVDALVDYGESSRKEVVVVVVVVMMVRRRVRSEGRSRLTNG